MNCKYYILLSVVAFIFSSCSNTKHLAANQNLFIGSTEKMKSTEKISTDNRKDLQEEMHSLVRPKPNTKFLGVRLKLTIHNMVKEPKKQRGLKYWLKYKVGEPPVIASMSALEKNRMVIQNHFDNRGYFQDSVTMDTTVKNKKLKVTYTATMGPRYTISQTT